MVLCSWRVDQVLRRVALGALLCMPCSLMYVCSLTYGTQLIVLGVFRCPQRAFVDVLRVVSFAWRGCLLFFFVVLFCDSFLSA